MHVCGSREVLFASARWRGRKDGGADLARPLEAQIVNGIAVLSGMEPEKTPVSATKVDEAVAEAEPYLKKHDLSVPAQPAKD